jgi:putative iron-only hydrogenase system regulator
MRLTFCRACAILKFQRRKQFLRQWGIFISDAAFFKAEGKKYCGHPGGVRGNCVCAFRGAFCFVRIWEEIMETRVAIVAIIVENSECVEKINELLHAFSGHIIGRLGLPYPQKGISIVSVLMDAPLNTINALSGKIGRLDGVSVKTVYSK